MVDGACAYLAGPISSAPSAWFCDLTETLKVQPAVDPIATADWPEKARLDAVMTLLKESLVTRRARVFHFIETRTGDADWPFASRAGLPFDIRVETFSFGSGVEHRAEFMRHINRWIAWICKAQLRSFPVVVGS
jgi:hypothetical protein